MPSLPIDDQDAPLFTVGQVAASLEVQHAFLRRLDEFGVVSPSRSAGGQRRYTRREVTVVAYVQRLVADGLTLAAIRRVLQLEDQVRQLEVERDRLRARLNELEAEREALSAALGERDALVARASAFVKTHQSRDRNRP